MVELYRVKIGDLVNHIQCLGAFEGASLSCATQIVQCLLRKSHLFSNGWNAFWHVPFADLQITDFDTFQLSLRAKI